MKRAVAVAVICSLPIFGCELNAKWRDLTGQNRSHDVVEKDQAGCRQSVGISESPRYEEFRAASPAFLACMRDHGWEFVPQKPST